MTISFSLHKMESAYADPVRYYLNSPDQKLCVNDLLGCELEIQYKNQINCIKCGAVTKTSFAQGYCYPCFMSAPETEDCVLRPELCQAHNHIARDMEYAERNCLIDHYVYMALSGGLKVGVTRYTQKPFRWIDQGAQQAIILAKTPNRFLAGCIEVALKKHFADKTNWRKMLSGDLQTEINLVKEKQRAGNLLHIDFREYISTDNDITFINYPVRNYPIKIKSIGFDKNNVIRGILSGIKGQYLIFDSGEVINIRKHSGYLVDFSYQ